MSDSFFDSYGSDSDPYLKTFKCVDCLREGKKFVLQTCKSCNGTICRSCGYENIGCAYEYFRVCYPCFRSKYNGKRKYCTDADCSCENKSKKFLTGQRKKFLLTQPDWKNNRKKVDVDKWKQKHSTIAYNSQYQGKYLIDLYMYGNDFESGYVQWLLNHEPNDDYGKEQRELYTIIHKEAQEIKELGLLDPPKPRRSQRTNIKKDRIY